MHLRAYKIQQKKEYVNQKLDPNKISELNDRGGKKSLDNIKEHGSHMVGLIYV